KNGLTVRFAGRYPEYASHPILNTMSSVKSSSEGASSADERWQPERPSRGRPPAEFTMLEVRDRVVISLLYDELGREEDIERAWYEWKRLAGESRHVPLWRVMAVDEAIDSDVVFAEAAKAYSFPFLKVEDQDLESLVSQVRSRVKPEQWEQLAALDIAPIRFISENGSETGRLILATHDPGRPDLLRNLKDLGFRNFEVWYAKSSFVREIIEEHSPDGTTFGEHEGLTYDLGALEDETSFDEDLDNEINKSALLALFEKMLRAAVRQGASDIHVFPNSQRKTEIHFRINGELSRWRVEDRVHPEAILAVIKDNSTNVDRFEREKA